MELLTLLHAMFLGVLEGLTEFLPVSSTGHLILFVDLLGFRGPPGRVFEVAIQFGAILAICWVYREKLLRVAAGLFARDADSIRFTAAVLLAFVPAVVIGVLLHGFIKGVLFTPWVVAVALVVGGIAILFIERNRPPPFYDAIERMPLAVPLIIGIAQTLAMIPGVSRAGATIMSALLLRVERRTATEFSFFLSIPTMLGAAVYDLYKNRDTLTFDGAAVIAIGFVFAFIAAMLVVRWVIAFISRHGFEPFGWYRIVLGVVMIAVLLVR